MTIPRRVPVLALRADASTLGSLNSDDEPPPNLTPRQSLAFDALVGFWVTHGRFPSYTQLAAVLGGIDRSNAYTLVAGVVAKGFLSKDSNGGLAWIQSAVTRVEQILEPGQEVLHEEDTKVYRAFLERVQLP